MFKETCVRYKISLNGLKREFPVVIHCYSFPVVIRCLSCKLETIAFMTQSIQFT